MVTEIDTIDDTYGEQNGRARMTGIHREAATFVEPLAAAEKWETTTRTAKPKWRAWVSRYNFPTRL